MRTVMTIADDCENPDDPPRLSGGHYIGLTRTEDDYPYRTAE